MEVESEINQSFTDLVVKLSEASFKPTLNKVRGSVMLFILNEYYSYCYGQILVISSSHSII